MIEKDQNYFKNNNDEAFALIKKQIEKIERKSLIRDARLSLIKNGIKSMIIK